MLSGIRSIYNAAKQKLGFTASAPASAVPPASASPAAQQAAALDNFIKALAASLVAARAGTAVNNIDKFVLNLTNTSGLENPAIVIIALLFVYSAAKTTAYIRYPNMVRQNIIKREAAEFAKANAGNKLKKNARRRKEAKNRRKTAEQKRNLKFKLQQRGLGLPDDKIDDTAAETKPSEAEVLLQQAFQEFAKQKMNADMNIADDEQRFIDIIFLVLAEIKNGLSKFIESEECEEKTSAQDKEDILCLFSLVNKHHDTFEDIHKLYRSDAVLTDAEIAAVKAIKDIAEENLSDAMKAAKASADRKIAIGHTLTARAKKSFEDFCNGLERIKLPAIASFFNTGVKSNPHHPGYIFFQCIVAPIYLFGSAMSGIQSTNMLIRLISRFLNLFTSAKYDDACASENQSSLAILIPVWIVMAMLVGANIYSFLKYNIPASRDYFPELWMNINNDGGYKRFSRTDHFKNIVQGLIGTGAMFYGNFVAFPVMTNNVLCHFFGKLPLSTEWNKSLSWLIAINSFIWQNGLMNPGAAYRKIRKAAEKGKVSKDLPNAEDADKPVKELDKSGPKTEATDILPPVEHSRATRYAIIGNTINNLLGIANFVLSTPMTFTGTTLGLAGRLLMLIPAIAVMGVSVTNIFNQDNEGAERENATRTEEKRREHANTILKAAEVAVELAKSIKARSANTPDAQKAAQENMKNALDEAISAWRLLYEYQKIYQDNKFFINMFNKAVKLKEDAEKHLTLQKIVASQEAKPPIVVHPVAPTAEYKESKEDMPDAADTADAQHLSIHDFLLAAGTAVSDEVKRDNEVNEIKIDIVNYPRESKRSPSPRPQQQKLELGDFLQGASVPLPKPAPLSIITSDHKNRDEKERPTLSSAPSRIASSPELSAMQPMVGNVSSIPSELKQPLLTQRVARSTSTIVTYSKPPRNQHLTFHRRATVAGPTPPSATTPLGREESPATTFPAYFHSYA